MVLGLLWPTFAFVALMLAHRIGALVARPRSVGGAGPMEPAMLYFAWVALVMLAAQVTPAQVVLAWLFVATTTLAGIGRPRRVLESAVWMLLAVMWIGFLVDAVAAARGYHAALSLGTQP